MSASRTRRYLSYLAALVLIAFSAAFVVEIVNSGQAQAQSSVRPPANATNATGGTVPGMSRSSDSASEIWRAVRKGVKGTVSIPDQNAGQLVQSEGDNWRAFRNGPMSVYGAWAMLGMLILLAVFFLLRGRVKIESGFSGLTVTRFSAVERLGHWLVAVSFVLHALTGLNMLYGRYVLLPVIGPDAFTVLSNVGKWYHNYGAFAFIVGLVIIFVFWVLHNIPNRYDLIWLAKGGGLFSKHTHPPARKFNGGQKMIFWVVVLGGFSLTMSGIALMFPFQFTFFSYTFSALNIFGLGLPTDLTLLQEQQLNQLWHALVALAMTAVIMAHIYIGTLGMEGAISAMWSGDVDRNWAKEHHSVWVEEGAASTGSKKKKSAAAAAPAE